MNLIGWQILNLLLGNSDGHAKNLSILYTYDGPRLAPFYDIVCTRIYKNINTELAFSIGGKNDPGRIAAADWNNFAEELEISPRLIFRRLKEYTTAIESNIDIWLEEFSRTNGQRPVTQRINQLLRKQCRRTLSLL